MIEQGLGINKQHNKHTIKQQRSVYVTTDGYKYVTTDNYIYVFEV